MSDDPSAAYEASPKLLRPITVTSAVTAAGDCGRLLDAELAMAPLPSPSPRLSSSPMSDESTHKRDVGAGTDDATTAALSSSDLNTGNLLLRVAVTAAVAVSWAFAAQFTKSALNVDRRHFYAPYSLVWFNTCFMLVCYPIYALYTRISPSLRRQRLVDIHRDAALVFSPSGITFLSVLRSVIPFVILWVMANYAFSQSLGRISASAATSIMSSNAAMVCILSTLVLRDRLTLEKIFAVTFAIGGVIVISFDSEFAGDWIGITLVTVSAAAAAVYKVLFKQCNGTATLGQVSMFMSALGALNAFLNIIPAIVLVLTDIDHIEWNAVPWAPLCGSSLLGLAFNFLVNFGIALLGPLTISIGMLCGIPLSAAIDIVFRGMDVTLLFMLGASLIIVSFVLSTIPLRQLIHKCRTNRVNK